jgi:hypothetical protein
MYLLLVLQQKKYAPIKYFPTTNQIHLQLSFQTQLLNWVDMTTNIKNATSVDSFCAKHHINYQIVTPRNPQTDVCQLNKEKLTEHCSQ